jgi:ubiquitin-like protein 4
MLQHTHTYTASISITFKSAKPPASYTLSVQPTDTVASIKAQLAAATNAPPPDAQRLLLKGKALADSKLLKEYTVKDGDTVNLIVKPGVDWDPTKPKEETKPAVVLSPTPTRMPTDHKPGDLNLGGSSSGRKGHSRIPSVVLSPSPSNESPGVVEKDILLTLDRIPSPAQSEDISSFGVSIANPEFWEKLWAFLK